MYEARRVVLWGLLSVVIVQVFVRWFVVVLMGGRFGLVLRGSLCWVLFTIHNLMLDVAESTSPARV